MLGIGTYLSHKLHGFCMLNEITGTTTTVLVPSTTFPSSSLYSKRDFSKAQGQIWTVETV